MSVLRPRCFRPALDFALSLGLALGFVLLLCLASPEACRCLAVSRRMQPMEWQQQAQPAASAASQEPCSSAAGMAV